MDGMWDARKREPNDWPVSFWLGLFNMIKKIHFCPESICFDMPIRYLDRDAG